jgi:hypothetical protein
MRLVVSAGALVLVAACEPRIDERTPPRPQPVVVSADRPQPQPPPPPSPPSRPLPPRPAPPPPVMSSGRCVTPTADAPPPSVDPGPDPACPHDPTGRLKLRHGRVEFEEAATSVEVEIADEHKARLRGLMYRKSLGEEQGMIFVFEERQVHSFWMKNTCLPLDMLFIDHDGLIVGIEENVPTMNEKSYRVGCPSLYVLEVNAGWSRRHGVKAGQRVKLEL